MRMLTAMFVAALLIIATGAAPAPWTPPVTTAPAPMIPQDHDYQRVLAKYLTLLTEADFAVDVMPIKDVPITDPDEQYRLWVLGQHPINVTAARLPAAGFTLAAIETAGGVMLPAPASESHLLCFLATWDHPGNPYRDSKSLKLRAFVLSAVDVMMTDRMYEDDPKGWPARSDFLGGNMIWWAKTYATVKDVLPDDVRRAFETGLRKHALRLKEWGPTGAMTDMDLFAPVGLCYLATAMNDPEITKLAEEYSRVLFTDEHYFNKAGYFVDNGCFDTSYNGISLYFGAQAALMSGWKFADEAIDQAFKLRAHLSFPDPDAGGGFSGPSAMASRCSGDPPHDQWQFQPKQIGGGMVTDHALYLSPLPDAATLAATPDRVAANYTAQLAKPRESKPALWQETHWSGGPNWAWEFYPKGEYARRLKLQEADSPLMKPLYQRGEKFVRQFGDAFLVARFDGFATAIHTGPIGLIDKRWHRPYGHGGGQLCAFWSPAGGATLLTRRRGIQGHTWDQWEEWRIWPIHAVSGLLATGEFATSSRIIKPQTEYHVREKDAEVIVRGAIQRVVPDERLVEPTAVKYERKFVVNGEGVTVTTSLKADTAVSFTELYETIPIFLRETDSQTPTTIEFLVGDTWAEATTDIHDIKAVRAKRFNGAMVVTFTEPQRAKLSPAVWKDGFQTQAECRTVLVDLLARDGHQLKSATITYTISTDN